jgi:hypothetical protein
MNYVGICFFTEIGRCLCGPVAGGSGNAVTNDQAGRPSVGDLHVSLAAVSTIGVRTSEASAAGGGQGKSSAFAGSGGHSGDSLLGFGSVSAAEPSWGGGSGGAPTPELNAGLGLLLVGFTVVVLRRRRSRQPA